MTVVIFVGTVWTVFEKIEKKIEHRLFFGHFGLILAMFLTFQPDNFDAIVHAGAPLGVE